MISHVLSLWVDYWTEIRRDRAYFQDHEMNTGGIWFASPITFPNSKIYGSWDSGCWASIVGCTEGSQILRIQPTSADQQPIYQTINFHFQRSRRKILHISWKKLVKSPSGNISFWKSPYQPEMDLQDCVSPRISLLFLGNQPHFGALNRHMPERND